MPLAPGVRLGAYEVVALIGRGGMGEVYRARDTKLNRDVALKVLPDSFANDPERLARFQREAQVLASLNHQNIGGIYGLEDAGDVHALVLELVEGPTLADRIAQGPIPLNEALPIARQIAEALETAHEHGIIHRDLKPANVKLRPDGVVKVLDFGLAKALAPDAASATAGVLSQSPTITSPAATRLGMILGTAAYMSPEQARGAGVDKRADIWSFGCVLYEMLTGRQPFEGGTVTEVLAGILKTDPDWTALPDVPSSLKTTIRRCLEKDRNRRLRDIGDARLEIEAALATPPAAPATDATSRRRVKIGAAAAWGLAGLIAGVVAGTLIGSNAIAPAEAPRRVTRFAIIPEAQGPGSTFRDVAISSDGTQILYQVERAGTVQLQLRSIDQIKDKPLAGTDGGTFPFFSPAGDQIAFGALREQTLKRLPVAGGSAVTICSFDGDLAGASWGSDGGIIFAQIGARPGLLRVPASGGMPEMVAKPDAARNEREYRYPQILPRAEWVLFTIVPLRGGIDAAQIVVRSLATGEQNVIIESGADAAYVATGHIVYGRSGALMAAPFDLARLEVTGPSVAIQQDVAISGAGDAAFTTSADGTLVYLPGSADPGRTMIWVSRDGKSIEPIPSEVLRYARYPRLSPDGRRLAVTLGPAYAGDVWIYDLGGERQPLKLTFEGHDTLPIWAPDAKAIVFQSDEPGPRNLFSILADGSAVRAERLLTSEPWHVPLDWSPDGTAILFEETQTGTRSDLWVLPSGGDRKPKAWLQTRFNEGQARFSPDGRWIAYVSDQTGRNEIWVRAYPGPGAPIRISPDGGEDPVWSPNGGELYYQNGTRLMSARVLERQPGFRFEPSRPLFEGGFITSSIITPRTYDAAPDGRFLMIQSADETVRPQFVLVQNWFDELKRLVPTN